MKAFLHCLTVITALLATPVFAQSAPLSAKDFLEDASTQIQNIDTEQLQALLKTNPNVELLDVRLIEEVASQGGFIKAGRRTHHLPRGWVEFRIEETIPRRDTPIVVYCSTNRRSPLAALALQKMGYTQVWNYTDGFLLWQEQQHPVSPTDRAVGTALFQRPMQVSANVYSAIGATAPATFENSGHNNNLSFVIGDDSVLVVNAGDNYLLASALHSEIKTITDKPVKYVVLENAQGHAMLGMNYWQQQGAEIIAHQDAADTITTRGETSLANMQRRNRDKAMGTVLSSPDITFDDKYTVSLGGVDVEVLYLGPAHSPGDVSVWLPEQRLVIAGDIAFHERLLPVFEYTDTQGWIETWSEFEALDPLVVVPGHGHPTTMEEVTQWTIGYLSYMRETIGELLENDGSLIDAYKIDQSAYQHLDTFDELAGLNADRIYRAMEFE